MRLGKLTFNDREYNAVHVALTNYASVKAILHEPHHTRLLIFGPKNRGFWSPVCEVRLASRIADRRLIGVCAAMEFKAETYLQIMNIVVADYDERSMTRALDFEPFEIQSGHTYRLEYQFLLRGRKS